MKVYTSDNLILKAYKRGGYYIFRMCHYNRFLVATKYSKEAHVEEGWGNEYEKKFETSRQANKYFEAIRRNNPKLRLVSDEPNKYISYDGTIQEF